MISKLPLIDEDGEVGDLSLVDPGLFRPAAEVLPPSLYAQLLALNKANQSDRHQLPLGQKQEVHEYAIAFS